MFFFFKQKTAYESRISEWSSDVCSSDVREIGEELGVTLEEGFQMLPVSNRFIYTSEHMSRRALDHDGQDATMFAVQLPSDVQIVIQAEEIAEVRWFSREEALCAFPVQKQRKIFEACLGKIAA